MSKWYRLKKRFYFKNGGWVEKGTLLQYTDSFGGAYWWDLDYFDYCFVEENKEFFEEVGDND